MGKKTLNQPPPTEKSSIDFKTLRMSWLWKWSLHASTHRKKLLMFDECCGCEEEARHEMDGHFCGLVMFLTRLSVSVILILKLFFLWAHYTMPSQEWDAYNDLSCVDFVRRPSMFELSLITVCNHQVFSIFENAHWCRYPIN